jgi:hypothetical protein
MKFQKLRFRKETAFIRIFRFIKILVLEKRNNSFSIIGLKLIFIFFLDENLQK